MNYAYYISGYRRDFVAKLNGENTTWQIDRRSDYINAIGQREDSHGFCQINRIWHSEIVDDPRFSDYKWQLDQCWRLYKGGTTFYAPPRYSDLTFLND